MVSKTCSKCKEVKTVDCFSKKTANKDGLQFWCKECRNKDASQYRLKNPETVKAYAKKWYADNLSVVRARQGKYYLDNSEKITAATRQWYVENLAKAKASQKKYNLANSEKRKHYENTRRAKKLDNGVFKILNKEIIKLYASPCLYCGSTELVQADHVIPIKRGGVHSIGNLVPACRSCNSSKGSKLLMEWSKSRHVV